MATLTAKARRAMPASSFAIPGKNGKPDAYPIPDAAHARDALARVAQNGTPAEQAQVRRAVARKFPGMKLRKSI